MTEEEKSQLQAFFARVGEAFSLEFQSIVASAKSEEQLLLVINVHGAVIFSLPHADGMKFTRIINDRRRELAGGFVDDHYQERQRDDRRTRH